MESKKGTALTGIDPVVGEIQQRLQTHPKDPGRLAHLEQEIQRAFAQMAARVMAELLAQSTAGPDFSAAAKTKQRVAHFRRNSA